VRHRQDDVFALHHLHQVFGTADVVDLAVLRMLLDGGLPLARPYSQ
jgi:hypothetical protein